MIEFEEEEQSGGSPAWMATFADLMSLLMCFFVLLLSFSEMDVLKYKQIAGSMKDAFGVQNDVNVKDIPKGTSIIAQEFSSGRPDPTPLNEVKQATADTTKQSLDVRTAPPGTEETKSKDKLTNKEAEVLLEKKLQELMAETADNAKELAKKMKKEVDAGLVDIESKGRSITIRIREKGSFPSGSATLNPDFIPVMAKLRDALMDIDGKIAVEGHTDDIPITSYRFKSNWDLSAFRALSVTHELVKDDILQDNRFMVIGYADTRPYIANDSAENRAKNRRVEIVVRQGLDDETAASIKDIQKSNPEILDDLNLPDSN